MHAYTAMLQVCEDFVIPSILGMFFNAPMIIVFIIFKDISICRFNYCKCYWKFIKSCSSNSCLYINMDIDIKLFINLKDERIKKILILLCQ